MYSNDFWNRFWANTVGFYLVGLIVILIMVGDHSNYNSLYQFQHDLFASLTGQEMQYGREDARKIANVLREIPAERLDEDFGYLIIMSTTKDDNARIETAKSSTLANPTRAERLMLYADMINNWSEDEGNDFEDTVVDYEMLMTIKRVLQGGEIPPLEPPSGVGQTLIITALITQFLAFLLYTLICLGSGDKPFDLPKGAGSKIAMLFFLPSGLPLMILIWLSMLLHRVGKNISSGVSSRSPTPIKLSDKPGAAARRSQEALERIKNRMKEG